MDTPVGQNASSYFCVSEVYHYGLSVVVFNVSVLDDHILQSNLLGIICVLIEVGFVLIVSFLNCDKLAVNLGMAYHNIKVIHDALQFL